MELNGVWLSVPVADLISILITAAALILYYNKHKKQGLASREELANEYG